MARTLNPEPGQADHVICYRGRCHCGALGSVYLTRLPPVKWRVRACACSFCRAHGAETTSDPDGEASFIYRDRSRLQRYRFGRDTADFILCQNCGVYLGAEMSTPMGRWATLNVRTFVPAPAGLPAALRVVYEDESRASRIRRRQASWTPVRAEPADAV